MAYCKRAEYQFVISVFLSCVKGEEEMEKLVDGY